MSNTESDIIVMVRAAGGVPVRLRVLEASFTHVKVGEIGGSASINFPISDVFLFDNALFEQLRTAHRDGDDGKLSQLWQLAHGYKD